MLTQWSRPYMTQYICKPTHHLLTLALPIYHHMCHASINLASIIFLISISWPQVTIWHVPSMLNSIPICYYLITLLVLVQYHERYLYRVIFTKPYLTFLLRSYRATGSSILSHIATTTTSTGPTHYQLLLPLPYMLAITTLYQFSVIVDTTRSSPCYSYCFIHAILPWLRPSPVDDIICLTMTGSLTSSLKYLLKLVTYKVLGVTKLSWIYSLWCLWLLEEHS